MKKILYFIFLVFLCQVSAFGQTRYYKQLKIISENLTEQKGDGGGQFITFSNNGCYDSDKNGYSVGNGSLAFRKKDNGRAYYGGNSYWGEAVYIFTENYQRLNIRPANSKKVYVYVLSQPLTGTQTCTLIRKPTPVDPATIRAIEWIMGGGQTAPIGIPESTTGTGTKGSSTYSERCSRCSGSGTVVASGTSYVIEQKWCRECNQNVSGSHYHTTCTDCNGTGTRTRTR